WFQMCLVVHCVLSNLVYASKQNIFREASQCAIPRFNTDVFCIALLLQCGKPLPGLTKQDDCCGSVGASWGLNKCQKCPKTPAYAVIANGQVECPKGYKRMNATHCQDINECAMTGLCKNHGFMLDPARSHCVSDKAVSENKGLCYRFSSAGACTLPLPASITKQICCCSRVGKAWGPGCERCPVPDSGRAAPEICPAGHGYTYSRSDVQISLRQLEEADLRNTGITWLDPSPLEPEWPPYCQSSRTPTPTNTNNHHQHHVPQVPVYPEPPQVTQHHPQPQTPHQPRQPPPTPAEQPVDPRENTRQPASEWPGQPEDKCALAPNICGHGTCVSVQTGYTCSCDPGYKLSALQTNYMNECEQNPCEGRGHCVNTFGSYTCHCHSGFSQVITQNRKFCQDINECSMPNKCQDGDCVNTEGSYTCECKTGYAMSWRGLCEDIDECREAESCPDGVCTNTPGSFHCRLCGPGTRPSNGRCVDVDECVLPGVCTGGRCVNLEGTHECVCGPGYQATPDSKACEDVNECAAPNVCPVGICVNGEGSFSCQECRPGFRPSADGLSCEDIDECALPNACPGGTCTNTDGSFTCLTCRPGFRVPEDGHQCEDVNECLTVAGICGEGECLNTEGSYVCICSDGYTTGTGATGCQGKTSQQRHPEGQLPRRHVQQVLSRNTTKQECCCTIGAGWGDNCEVHPCPFLREVGSRVKGQGIFIIPEGQFDPTMGDTCVHGVCVNTAGSFNCFCSPPLVLDGSGRRCIGLNATEGGTRTHTQTPHTHTHTHKHASIQTCSLEPEQDVHMDICWQVLVEDNMCANPLAGHRTTYTECCCLYGVAWSEQCAFCPNPGVQTAFQSLPTYVRTTPESTVCLFRALRRVRGPPGRGVCGILNGCENGRCVRVREGYTCDCFDGYELDLNKMPASVDINECEDISDSVALCQNARCSNTEGSYKCSCLAGFVASAKPHECIPEIPQEVASEAG
uniref:Latent-transforming growth factor beta-binding protein 4 n=1 Tax=Gadus morhua TaxID=8049 RepID=A0A8C4ZKS2_GADMO